MQIGSKSEQLWSAITLVTSNCDRSFFRFCLKIHQRDITLKSISYMSADGFQALLCLLWPKTNSYIFLLSSMNTIPPWSTFHIFVALNERSIRNGIDQKQRRFWGQILSSSLGVIVEYGIRLPTISPIQSGTKNLVSEQDCFKSFLN